MDAYQKQPDRLRTEEPERDKNSTILEQYAAVCRPQERNNAIH